MNNSKPTVKMERLGDRLVADHLISSDQLNEACRRQTQMGERLGSVLVELNFLSAEKLAAALGRYYGLTPANLFDLKVPQQVLDLLPVEKMLQFHALPVARAGKKVQVAMVDPNDIDALRELQFILGTSIQPLVIPSFQMTAALQVLERIGEAPQGGLDGSQLASRFAHTEEDTQRQGLKNLFRMLAQQRASDLLLVSGAPPTLKKDNQLVRLSAPVLTPQDVGAYARQLMTDAQLKRFVREKELDFAQTVPGLGRFRINIFRQRNTFSIAVRHIIENIPSREELGLPPWVEDFALKRQGLILVTGPTGHGKTTTMAALIDIINSRTRRNIITIEDPIEYHHRHKASNVNQREIGVDTDSFSDGLRHIFREAPDVIVIGEMRDPESFAIALQAADTGHLVISCLHSNNAVMAINRIIDVFPPEQQRQVRVQMADNFLLILNQRLIARKNGDGRVLACEKLVNTSRVRNLIREGKENQIRTLLQTAKDDFWSLDVTLAALCRDGVISSQTALQYCTDLSFFNSLMSTGIQRTASN